MNALNIWKRVFVRTASSDPAAPHRQIPRRTIMFRRIRDPTALERDARCEHDFYRSLTQRLERDLEDAQREIETLRDAVARGCSGGSGRASTTTTTAAGRSDGAGDADAAGMVGARGEDEARSAGAGAGAGERLEASNSGGEATAVNANAVVAELKMARDALAVKNAELEELRRQAEEREKETGRAEEENATEKRRLLEELEEMRDHMRTATASAHKANAEVNAVAHQNRTLMEKEKRRAEAAEANARRLAKELEAARSGAERNDRLETVREDGAEGLSENNERDVASSKSLMESNARAEELEDELRVARAESEMLREANSALEVRLQAVLERIDALESDMKEDLSLQAIVEEKERAIMGRNYADEAAVMLRRTALETQAMANAFHARLYPDGDPERDKIVRKLVIVHAVLTGHPFEDACRDVTRAVRARLQVDDGKRLVILVSENLSDLIPDPEAKSLDTRLTLRETVNGADLSPRPTHESALALEKNASLRIVYAFDNVDEAGNETRGDEKAITIPIGAAGTAHAFAMQSLWIEAQPTGIEGALKAAYARLRDAEATASSAKSRAITLHSELIRARHHAGSTERARQLTQRELVLEKREADLNAEIIELESAAARARTESESIRLDAARAVSDISERLQVAEEEIARLRAVESAVTRAQSRSKSWRRETVALSAADEDVAARRRAAIGAHRNAASTLELAEARLARLTAATIKPHARP